MVSPLMQMTGWPWALDSRHHSWPIHTMMERGPDLNTESERQKHSQTWSTGSECCRLDKSGIIIVRTCVETQQIRLCLLHECLQWLSLGQNNWPIFDSTWLCNRVASMVSAWLGICNASCYTYMNVSNDCHSAKTTGQFCVAHGFAMASHHSF